jgi:hypothetical protein
VEGREGPEFGFCLTVRVEGNDAESVGLAVRFQPFDGDLDRVRFGVGGVAPSQVALFTTPDPFFSYSTTHSDTSSPDGFTVPVSVALVPVTSLAGSTVTVGTT